MRPKQARISVRVSQELKTRVGEVVERTGINEPTLVINCIEALCDHVERHGQISFPMSLNAAGVVPLRYPKAGGSHGTMQDKPKKPKP